LFLELTETLYIYTSTSFQQKIIFKIIFSLQPWLVITKGAKMLSAYLGAEFCSLSWNHKSRFSV